MTVFSSLRGGSAARDVEHSVPCPSRSPANTDNHRPSVGRNISSGSPPQIYAVDIPEPPAKTRQHWKPWLNLRNYWVHIQERRERTRLFFFRKKADQVLQADQRDLIAASLSKATELGDSKIIEDFERGHVLDANEMGALGDEPTQEIHTPVNGLKGRLPAFVAHRIRHKEDGTAQELSMESSESISTSLIVGENGGILRKDVEPPPEPVGSQTFDVIAGPSDSERRLILSYVVPDPSPGDSEFTSSALMVKEPSGELRAEKVWYDTGSIDNWVSEKFVQSCGLTKRPFRKEDVYLYSTAKGDIIPTHYVELEVQDKRRGMTEFDKLKLNVTPDMDGIGLLVGRIFINKHHIVLTPGEPRDNYVATRRKPNAQELKKHEELMKQADEEYELAKMLESTTGSSSDPTTESSLDEKVAGSSTSASIPKTSDTKSKVRSLNA